MTLEEIRTAKKHAEQAIANAIQHQIDSLAKAAGAYPGTVTIHTARICRTGADGHTTTHRLVVTAVDVGFLI